jgi:hypothetical protein
MSQISGTAYHFSPSPPSQSWSGWKIGTSSTASAGMSNACSLPSPLRTISGSRSNRLPAPCQPRLCASSVSAMLAGSPRMPPPGSRYPAYWSTWPLMIRGPGRPGASGANTVITDRTRPRSDTSRRCVTVSPNTSRGSLTCRRSRSFRTRHLSRPEHRPACRHATRAAQRSSSRVCA